MEFGPVVHQSQDGAAFPGTEISLYDYGDQALEVQDLLDRKTVVHLGRLEMGVIQDGINGGCDQMALL